MAAGHIGTWAVKEGRREEFLAVQAAFRAWAEGHGAVHRVRAIQIAGAESGRISATSLFEDPPARAGYMDATAADVANNPIPQMVRAGNPPATSISRVLFNEIDEPGGIPDSRPLQVTRIFEVGPGQIDEAQAALQAAKQESDAAGRETRNFRIFFFGSTPGRLARVQGFDSWAAFEEATAQPGPPPVLAAAASGALNVISMSSSREIDL